MPEFILIRREKKDVVRRLVIRAATLKYEKEKDKFEQKVQDIVNEGED